MMRSRLTLLCSGMIAGDPGYGGATWAVLQYLLGFQQLGHDVYFVEPVPREKLQPAGCGLAASSAGRWFRRVVRAFGIAESSALLLEGTTQTVGLTHAALRRVASRADALINISGMLTDAALLEPIRRRVFLDLDPGFNQAWHNSGDVDMRFDAHTHFATVGLALGRSECRVPTCGRTWMTTCPPVVLRQWPVARGEARDPFTTVANWRSYGSIHHGGLFLGQKVHSLRALIDLPRKTRQRFELALAIHPEEPDLAVLRRNGWTLVDPLRAAGSPAKYRRFVGSSRGELGIAKSGYIASRSGWFSDRSACYLAAGRPVLAQDTGFGDVLPAGDGLLTFSTEADALAGLDAIQSDYERHRDAARALAERYFDSDRVLTHLLDRVGAAS